MILNWCAKMRGVNQWCYSDVVFPFERFEPVNLSSADIDVNFIPLPVLGEWKICLCEKTMYIPKGPMPKTPCNSRITPDYSILSPDFPEVQEYLSQVTPDPICIPPSLNKFNLWFPKYKRTEIPYTRDGVTGQCVSNGKLEKRLWEGKSLTKFKMIKSE